MAALLEDDDRRRSPRFVCGGDARIVRLPSEGVPVSGKLRNLSVGGICVDASSPLDLGAKTEILVSAHAVTFRTVGLVRAVSDRSRTCLEFVNMTAGGRSILGELLDQMARLQKVMKKLRSARLEMTEELSRELEEAGVRMALCDRLFSPGTKALDPSGEQETQGARPELIVRIASPKIKVDLLG